MGNYYFMTSRLQTACNEFERALLENPLNNDIRKKLVICYLSNGEIAKSLKLFITLIRQDASIIIKAKNDMNCPCIEIINKFESEAPAGLDEIMYNKALGMLWLYRDKTRSVQFFEKVKSLNRNDSEVKEILNILSAFR